MDFRRICSYRLPLSFSSVDHSQIRGFLAAKTFEKWMCLTLKKIHLSFFGVPFKVWLLLPSMDFAQEWRAGQQNDCPMEVPYGLAIHTCGECIFHRRDFCGSAFLPCSSACTGCTPFLPASVVARPTVPLQTFWGVRLLLLLLLAWGYPA